MPIRAAVLAVCVNLHHEHPRPDPRTARVTNDSKIVLLVADGLGGLPLRAGRQDRAGNRPHARTSTPARATASAAAASRCCPGITPGSGPGHLGLFGYDPLEYRIGRGILEALGINFEVGPTRRRRSAATSARSTPTGKITDRRAGRIASEKSAPLAMKLRQIKIPGVEMFVEPVREHRFVVVFRGDGLGDDVNDTDPQATGVPPLEPTATTPAAQKTAEVVNRVRRRGGEAAGRTSSRANGLTLRGFAGYPKIATLRGSVRPARRRPSPSTRCTRGWPGWSAWTSLGPAQTLGEQIDVLKRMWDDYDFFFLHYKYTDSTGEDGNFAAKVKMIEELDAVMPKITALEPDVLIVTGDHSTPSKLKSHSWHPVPTLLVGEACRPDARDGVRRERLPARRAGPVRGEVPDDAGAGPRRPAGQVWGLLIRPVVSNSSDFTNRASSQSA